MKLELNTSEATDLFAALAQSSKVSQLEMDLTDARSERDSAYDSRQQAWFRNEQLEREVEEHRRVNSEVQREISSLRREIEIMLDQAKPFFRERKFSRMFELYRAGQKIPCIKELREVMKLGLKEAKDIVERVFTDGTRPELYALCQVFVGIEQGRIIDDLREDLCKVLKTDLSVDDLNRVLHGEFHEPDIKF